MKMMNELDDNVWIELQLNNNDKLLCGCMYRSPKKEVQYIKNTKKVCKVIQEATHMQHSHLLIWGISTTQGSIGFTNPSMKQLNLFNPSLTQYKAVNCFNIYLNQPDLEMAMNQDYWTLYLLTRKEGSATTYIILGWVKVLTYV